MAIFYADYYNGDDGNDGLTTGNPVKNPTALVGSLSAGDEIRFSETAHSWTTLSGTFTSDRTNHTISTSDDHSATLALHEYIRVTYTDEAGNSAVDYFRMSVAATSSLLTLDTRDEFIPDGSTITSVEHLASLASNTVDMDIDGVVGTEANPIKISGGWKFGVDTTEPTGETIGLKKSAPGTTKFFDISASTEYVDLENFIVLGWDPFDNGQYIKMKDIYFNGSRCALSSSTSISETLLRGPIENCTFKGTSASSFSEFFNPNKLNDPITFDGCRFISNNITDTSNAFFKNVYGLTLENCEFIGVNRLAWECYNLTIDTFEMISNESMSTSVSAWIDDCDGVYIKDGSIDFDDFYHSNFTMVSASSNVMFENVDFLNHQGGNLASNSNSVDCFDCEFTLDSGSSSPTIFSTIDNLSLYKCSIELKPSATSFLSSCGPVNAYDCTVTNPDSIPDYLGNEDNYRRVAFHRVNADNDKHYVTMGNIFVESLPDDTHSSSLSFKIEGKDANGDGEFEIYTFVVTDDGSDIDIPVYYKTDSEPDHAWMMCISDGAIIERYRMQFIEDVKEDSPSATGNSTADWCVKTFTVPSANLTVGKEIKIMFKIWNSGIGERAQFDFSPAT